MSETEQAKIIDESDGFAEIYPEDKYKIVKLLQSKGHMVGMTGDGVNDAPALKQAELGIAVSSSTDVAKASASMVLTEPGVAVIIDAIKTSRHIYQRMLTWVINKVTKVIQVIGLLTIGFFWFHDLVVSLLGMTLLIFANDFVTMSLATDNVTYTANPNKWNVKNITFASLDGWSFTCHRGRNRSFHWLPLFPFATGTTPNFYCSHVDIYQPVQGVHRQRKKILLVIPSRQGISSQYNCGISCVFIAWSIWPDYPGVSSLSSSFCSGLFGSVYACDRFSQIRSFQKVWTLI